MRDPIRTVIFRPYRKGMGPVFTLRMFDTGGYIGGKYRVAYTLRSEGKTRLASMPRIGKKLKRHTPL